MPCHHTTVDTTGTTYDTFFKLKITEKTESKETNQTEKGKRKRTGIEKTVVPLSGDVASNSKERGKKTAPSHATYCTSRVIRPQKTTEMTSMPRNKAPFR